MCSKLLKTIAAINTLKGKITQKRKDFESFIQFDMAQLKDLQATEQKLRQDIITEMDEHKQTAMNYDNYSITKQIKLTKGIDNPVALRGGLMYYSETLKDAGIDVDVLIKNEFVETYNINHKDIVLDAVNKIEKLEGKLPDGIIVKETPFITVKKIR